MTLRQFGWMWSGVASSALMLTLWLASASPVYAQQRAGDLPENPSQIAFQHDGRNVTGFALYLSPDRGTPTRIDLGRLAPNERGVISAAIPPLPSGVYTAAITAYNANGESAKVSALPPRFRVRGSVDVAPAAAAPPAPAPQPPPTAATPAVAVPPPTAAAPQSPPDASTPANTAPPVDAAPRKKGIFGKIWNVVIGED